MVGGQSIDAAGDVYEVERTISRSRAAALRQPLRGSLRHQLWRGFPPPKPQQVLKIIVKSEQNCTDYPGLSLEPCAKVPPGLYNRKNTVDAQLK